MSNSGFGIEDAEMTLATLELETVDLPVDALYEVIDGQVVEVDGMGTQGSLVASKLFSKLDRAIQEAQLGRLVFETLFRVGGRNDRRPDLAFVSYSRWPKKAPVGDENAWDVVPDLMIEVVSKTDKGWEVLEKVRQYFDAGARAVWLIYPNLETFHVYESYKRIQVLTRGDLFEGGDLIPGFSCPLDSFFEEEESDEETPNLAD